MRATACLGTGTFVRLSNIKLRASAFPDPKLSRWVVQVALPLAAVANWPTSPPRRPFNFGKLRPAPKASGCYPRFGTRRPIPTCGVATPAQIDAARKHFAYAMFASFCALLLGAGAAYAAGMATTGQAVKEAARPVT